MHRSYLPNEGNDVCIVALAVLNLRELLGRDDSQVVDIRRRNHRAGRSEIDRPSRAGAVYCREPDAAGDQLYLNVRGLRVAASWRDGEVHCVNIRWVRTIQCIGNTADRVAADGCVSITSPAGGDGVGCREAVGAYGEDQGQGEHDEDARAEDWCDAHCDAPVWFVFVIQKVCFTCVHYTLPVSISQLHISTEER